MNGLILLTERYGYLVLFPLAAFEGPVVSLVAGFLVYLGYFSFLPAYVILILGDVIPDTFYYYVGRFGNRKQVVEKYGARFGVIKNNFPVLEKLWRDHGRKTMFLSKLAYGLSTPFLISAGLVNMTLKRFLSYTIPVTLIQYGFLMTVGYYFGRSYASVTKYVEEGGFVFAGALVIFVVGYALIARYARKQIIIMEKEEEQ